MIIIGCDYHPGFQQIAFVDTETGDYGEQRLEHSEGAEKFYRDLAAQGKKVRVGMEASGHARWFERLLVELTFELWIGDASEIRARRVRKQKTDRQDAQHILQLLMENRFPKIWVPSGENRDLRQLLWHRHRMVQARTRIMNQLQAVALNEGLRCKKKLWRDAGREQLESFRLAPWASRRRRDLLELLDRLTPTIARTDRSHRAGSGEVSRGAALDDASRSRSADGIGLRADHRDERIGFSVASRSRAIWDWCRWKIPAGIVADWDTSRNKGNSLLRFLLVEAAQVTVRSLPEWRSKYFHLAMRRGRKIAKVAMARRLAVRLYWMWRKGWDYRAVRKFGSHAGQPGNRDGVQ